jgi:hypothetical protein
MLPIGLSFAGLITRALHVRSAPCNPVHKCTSASCILLSILIIPIICCTCRSAHSVRAMCVDLHIVASLCATSPPDRSTSATSTVVSRDGPQIDSHSRCSVLYVTLLLRPYLYSENASSLLLSRIPMLFVSCLQPRYTTCRKPLQRLSRRTTTFHSEALCAALKHNLGKGIDCLCHWLYNAHTCDPGVELADGNMRKGDQPDLSSTKSRVVIFTVPGH